MKGLIADTIAGLGSEILSRRVASGHPLPRRRQIQKFLDETLLAEILRHLRIEHLIDVGANRGQYAEGLRRMGYQGTIHSFEPIPADFAILSEKAGRDPNWSAYNFALGRSAGQSEFNVIGDGQVGSDYSSFLSPDDESIPAGIRKIPVEIRTLDSMLETIPALDGTNGPVFVKLDTQGYDMEVCAGAEAVLKIATGIQSEISVKPIYKDQPDYLAALAYFQDRGFNLLDLAIVTRAQNYRVVEYDCIFARVV